MSYQERALAIIDRLTDNKAINIRERGTLRRAILLPERPQGEWICYKNTEEETYQIVCKECGYYRSEHYGFKKLPCFCENCGAVMRKGGAE